VSVIVPMNLSALCVSGATPLRGAAADFSDLPLRPDDDSLLAGEAYLGSSVRHFDGAAADQGVHLHWALPEVFTRGAQRADGRVEFLPVPTRWLVTRLAFIDGKATPTSWVVESDAITDDAEHGSPSIPFLDPTGRRSFRFLGRVVPAATWREPLTATSFAGAARRPLTCVGWGEPGFSAYYPSCRNVFGLCDSLDDLDRGKPCTLSYTVVGWYANAADDPLASPGSLNWSFERGPGPRRTLCAGHLFDVKWAPRLGAPARDGSELGVALGNNEAECLSALLAHTASFRDDDNAELRLNAIQRGLLLQPVPPAGWLAGLDDAMHADTFTASDAGSLWVVREKARDRAEPDEGAEGAAALSPATATLLDALNLAQDEYDRGRAELRSAKQRLYQDWALSQVMQRLDVSESRWHAACADPLAFIDDVASPYLWAEAARLQRVEQALGEVTVDDAGRPRAPASASTAAALVARWLELAAALQKDHRRLTLQRVPAPRFWAPNDPMVLLSGPDAEVVDRIPDDVRFPARLPCRRVDELVKTITFAGGELVPELELPGTPYFEEAAALVRECALLSPAFGTHSAAALAHARGEAALPEGVTVEGVAPHPLALGRAARAPWLPLYLEWSARYRPASAPGREAAYGGVTALSAHAAVHLREQLRRLDPNGTMPALQQLRDELGDAPLLAQSLSGLHASMVAHHPRVQLDITDPWNRGDAVDAAVAGAVGQENTVGPDPSDELHPVRGGALQLTQLRLIDTFGQERTVALEGRVITATALAAPAGSDAHAALPPRLAQPARLDFRWISADDDLVESNSHPTTTPIFGWVVLNYVDNDLLVYDRDAKPLLTLAAGAGRGAVLVRPLPAEGRARPALRDRDSQRSLLDQLISPARRAARVADRQLHELLSALVTHPDAGGMLSGLLEAIDEALVTTLPHVSGVSADVEGAFGRPLALARVSLGLELDGWPTLPNDPTSFVGRLTEAVTGGLGGDELAWSRHSFGAVRFPVRLGGQHVIADGLVGYFRRDESARLRFESCTRTFTDDVRSADEHPLQLTCTPDHEERITLLLDPRGTVRAASGILPAKSIQLPPSHFEPALAALEPELAAGPLMFGPRPSLPLPDVAGRAWVWLAPGPDAVFAATRLELDGDRADASYSPLRAAEGWLRLVPHEEKKQ
jgi:hypothetical protein